MPGHTVRLRCGCNDGCYPDQHLTGDSARSKRGCLSLLICTLCMQVTTCFNYIDQQWQLINCPEEQSNRRQGHSPCPQYVQIPAHGFDYGWLAPASSDGGAPAAGSDAPSSAADGDGAATPPIDSPDGSAQADGDASGSADGAPDTSEL